MEETERKNQIKTEKEMKKPLKIQKTGENRKRKTKKEKQINP